MGHHDPRVYKHGRQLGDKAQLRQAVFHTWENIGTETLDQLNSSMRDHFVEVLDKNGRATRY